MSKSVLITGATSGIGYALSKLLVAKGYQVIATGRNTQPLAELAELGCLTFAADLTEPDQVSSLFAKVIAKVGRLDVLINNAGMNTRKCLIEEISLEELDYQYAINLRAPMLLCSEALKVMKPQQSGQIINVVSTVAKRTNATMSVYTAMKQGLAGFSAIAMKEAQPHGIKVSTLYPGGTDSNFRPADRPDYMQTQSVATVIAQLLELPDDLVMHEIVCRPWVELE